MNETIIKKEPEAVLDDSFKQKNRKGEIIPPDKIKKEGRKLKSLQPMCKVSPYIMKTRIGSMNTLSDTLRVDKIEEYIKRKRDQGFSNFTLMHVLIATYVRAASQRPGLNRFVRGQKVYARNNIEVCLTIKKDMTLDGEETVVKVFFYPDATVDDVYRELDKVVSEYRESPGGDFDAAAKTLSFIPGLCLKFTAGLLSFLDYFGWLPRFLTKLSPFHGSFFITSMGSLGIPPVVHHLYEFGNLPVFMSFGSKYRKNVIMDDGSVEKHCFVDFTISTDERICDGYYFASSFKFLRSIAKKPEQLDLPPEKVVKDIK